MGRYVVLPKADQDLDSIADYLADHGGLDVGLRFLAAAEETFALLAAHPGMGWKSKLTHPALSSVRVFMVSAFENTLVFYRPESDCVTILRVLHGSRDLEALFEREGLP